MYQLSFFLEHNSAWNTEVRITSRRWVSQVKAWLNYKEVPVLIVGYENLVKDTYTELKRMLDFIEYPYSDEDVKCTIKNSLEAFHRNHTKKVNPYSPDQQK